jgi:hypothetical protein
MTSAASAIEAVAFKRLDGEVGPATAYQHVPEDTPPPVVIVGDIDLDRMSKGGDPDRLGTLTITSIVPGEARKPLLDIQEKIETRMDGFTGTHDGWSVSFSFQSSDGLLAALPAADDESSGAAAYVGNSRFQVMATKD